MIVSRFRRIDTVTLPGRFLTVIEVSQDGVGPEMEDVRSTILGDRDSVDGILVSPGGCDPLDGAVHTIIREVRPKGMSVIVETSGADPDALDDLVGAGYASKVLIDIDGPLTDGQRGCIRVARDNGCGYSVSVRVSPPMDERALMHISEDVRGAESAVFRFVTGEKGFKRKEVTALAKLVKGCAREVTVCEITS